MVFKRDTMDDLSSRKREPFFWDFLVEPIWILWPAAAARAFLSSMEDFSTAPTCSWME